MPGGTSLSAAPPGKEPPTCPPYQSTVLTSFCSSRRETKKKKMTGFATLRRKLIRRRRTSKSFDHGKVMREFVSDWSAADLAALVDEYEATAALKDLSVQADLARPPASTFKQDLSDLFDYKCAADVTLVFQGACFPAHRAVLAARCAYFRELLAKPSAVEVHVDSLLQSRGIDVPTFAGLLRYLYTGDFSLDGPGGADKSAGGSAKNLDVLVRLGQEFGTPNALETDLRYLMETGDMADAVLVFASGQDIAASSAGPSGGAVTAAGSDYGFFPWLEIPCHRAILSARSPFFRSVIQRRTRQTGQQPDGPIRIILDESVIPRRYARVLMQSIYLDVVDLNCIVRPPPPPPAPPLPQQPAAQQLPVSQQADGSSDEQVITTTTTMSSSPAPPALRPAPPSLFEEATELYQIGRFLELDILAQGCEDILVDGLSLDQLPQVLRWSELPHGSPWVRRQALHLLREEFGSLAGGAPVLLELDKAHLAAALASDFLQASELEVLQAVLRWGEHQLVRRMEDREPNVVSQTTHSVARKGIRRRDLNDVELRDILSDLLPLVRMDHVLPPSSETLGQAIRRGLVSTPPSHMIGGDCGAHHGHQRKHPDKSAWIRGKKAGPGGLFVKPRLFMPYFEEAKTAFADHLAAAAAAAAASDPYAGRHPLMASRGMPLVASIRPFHHHHHHNIPDTLYMIDDEAAMALLPMSSAPEGESSGGGAIGGGPNDLDVVTGGAVPVPDSETLQAMIRRERKLRLSPLVQRAYALPLASRRDVNRQIRLRVVREFNLPDSIAEELELAAYQLAASEEEEEEEEDVGEEDGAGHAQQPVGAAPSNLVWRAVPLPVSVPVPPKRLTSSSRPFGSAAASAAAVPSASFMPDEDEEELSSRSQLSEFIPDIAALSIGPSGGGASGHFVPPLQPPEPYR